MNPRVRELAAILTTVTTAVAVPLISLAIRLLQGQARTPDEEIIVEFLKGFKK